MFFFSLHDLVWDWCIRMCHVATYHFSQEFLVGVAIKCRMELWNRWIGNDWIGTNIGNAHLSDVFFTQTTHMNFAQLCKQTHRGQERHHFTQLCFRPPHSGIKTEIQSWCEVTPGCDLDIRPRQILNHHATSWDMNWERDKAALGRKQRNKMFGHNDKLLVTQDLA